MIAILAGAIFTTLMFNPDETFLAAVHSTDLLSVKLDNGGCKIAVAR
ncbi:hypothetical protein [Bradyrhizobium cajani]|nr:hypothetical protein [Bradyrhizobium cajani]MCP3369594.1 hypothetical protein [Bradyrhizobium cajani]